MTATPSPNSRNRIEGKSYENIKSLDLIMNGDDWGIGLALLGIGFDMVLSSIQFANNGANTAGLFSFLGATFFGISGLSILWTNIIKSRS